MSESTRTSPVWLKPLTEYGPLVAFFAAYWYGGLITATAVIMGATAVSLALSLFFERRVPLMPLITAAVVGIFGGLTIYLEDETFIKMKPTIVQVAFGVILLTGLAFGRSFLKNLMGSAWAMDDEGWKKLTLRFGLFFLVMAALNEAVWRTQSTDFWVNFKVFGIIGLTLVFAMSQAPLISRHQLEDGEEDGNGA